MMPPDTAQPRLGCGALIRRDDGRILLVQRGRPPERGHWGLPGGKVDWMERVEDAVVREVFEETALRVRIARLLCVVDQFEPALAQHWVAPVYVATRAGDGEATIQEPDALLDLGWFDTAALPTPLTAATVRALAALADEAGAR
jgi:ADP-ribose pyrophosphatase YjhB (NUDIX family)